MNANFFYMNRTGLDSIAIYRVLEFIFFFLFTELFFIEDEKYNSDPFRWRTWMARRAEITKGRRMHVVLI